VLTASDVDRPSREEITEDAVDEHENLGDATMSVRDQV
jgi:hypothetical protein